MQSSIIRLALAFWSGQRLMGNPEEIALTFSQNRTPNFWRIVGRDLELFD
jgi:hypothetical protein